MSKVINVAIIGGGRVAFHHSWMLEGVENCKLVACCDIDREKADALAKKSNCKAYYNYHDMLKEEKVDLVTIATPTGAHYDHVKDILTHYKVNIVLEKPMVLRVSQGIELKELATQRGVNIFPVYQNRFNQAVERVKKAVIEGELGDLVLGTVRVRWCRPQRYYDLADWRGTYSMDGGAHVNQGIHYIDILRYIAGEIDQVFSCFARLGAKPEAEDTGVSLVKFKNGGLGQIEITMAARPDDFEASVSYVGSKGTAVLGGICTNELNLFSPSPEDEKNYSEEVPMVYGVGHKEVYRRIASYLEDGTGNPVEFDDGLQTIRVLHALYKSSETNQWVKLDDNLESERLGERNDALLKSYLTSMPVGQK